MDDDDPTTEELDRRQLQQEVAAREAEAEAETAAEADKHQRRADKARYLREKVLEQKQADEREKPD